MATRDENLPEIIRRNLRASAEWSNEQSAAKLRDSEHAMLKQEAEALRQSCFAQSIEINDLGRKNKQFEAEIAQIHWKYTELQNSSVSTLKLEIEGLKQNIVALKASVQFQMMGSARQME